MPEQADRAGDDLERPHAPAQHPEGDAHCRPDRAGLVAGPEERAADHARSGSHQGPHPDERGGGHGVAPAHAEQHRPDHDDEQGLSEGKGEVAEGLAQDEVAWPDRGREGSREDPELAGLDHRATPGQCVDEHEQDEHGGCAVVVAEGQVVALPVDDVGADRHDGSLELQ